MWGQALRASSVRLEQIGHPITGGAGGRSRPKRADRRQVGGSAADRRRSRPAAAFPLEGRGAVSERGRAPAVFGLGGTGLAGGAPVPLPCRRFDCQLTTA
jgi:hypothetical protein